MARNTSGVSRATVLALAVMLAVGLLAGIGAVTATPNNASTTATPSNNTTAPVSDDGWTQDELTATGEVYDPRYPSLRVTGRSTAFWLVNYPASGMNSYGGENANEEFVTSDTVVRRNKLRMYGTHPFTSEEYQYQVRLVYWHYDTKEVQTENGTITKRVVNVTGEGTQNVSFPGGFKQPADIHLAPHYADGERVTLILETTDGEDLARFPVFEHQSIATAQPVNIDSRGELYNWVLLWIIVPTLIIDYIVSRKVPAFRRRARAGTGHSPWFWIIPAFLLLGGIYIWGYTEFASLVVALPIVFPLLVAFVHGAIHLEDDDEDVETWGFLRAKDVEEINSPLDEDSNILDSATMEIESHDIIYDEDNNPCLYHEGILAMWARAKGKFTPLKVENQKAEWEGEGDYDKLIVVDSDSDDLVESRSERVIFAWPWRTYNPDIPGPEDVDDDSEWDELEFDVAKAAVLPREFGKPQIVGTLLFIGGLLGLAWLSKQHLGSWVWSIATWPAIALYYAEPVAGTARTTVARGQARAAWITAWYGELTMKRFGVVDDLYKEIFRANRQQFQTQEHLRSLKEEGLIEQAHEDTGQPFESLLVEEDPATSSPDTGGDD